jgi:Ca-activated chloride channel family protein
MTWGNYELHSPLYLLLLLLVPLIWWRWLARGRHAAVRFSSIAPLKRANGERTAPLRVRARVLLPILRSLAVITLVLCLSRPQKGNEQTRIFSEGIAIQAVVDVSGSMESLDFELDGKKANRLDVVKKVFRAFVTGEGEGLPGRPDDLIGLITFAGYADSKCPLTLDHATVVETLKEAQTAGGIETQRRTARLQNEFLQAQREGDTNRQRELQAEYALLQEEGGTAIGDGLGLAVKELSELDRRRGEPAAKVKSKVVVLMTDGQNNAGILDPKEAGKLAATFGIKAYCIGVGTRGMAPLPQLDPFGRVQLVPVPVDIDEYTMQAIADATGGKYFRATDTESLRNIYEEIDKLEKTKTEEKRYMQYKELATDSVRVGRWPSPPFLTVAGVLLALEMLLVNTWLRKVP